MRYVQPFIYRNQSKYILRLSSDFLGRQINERWPIPGDEEKRKELLQQIRSLREYLRDGHMGIRYYKKRRDGGFVVRLEIEDDAKNYYGDSLSEAFWKAIDVRDRYKRMKKAAEKKTPPDPDWEVPESGIPGVRVRYNQGPHNPLVDVRTISEDGKDRQTSYRISRKTPEAAAEKIAEFLSEDTAVEEHQDPEQIKTTLTEYFRSEVDWMELIELPYTTYQKLYEETDLDVPHPETLHQNRY